MTEILLDVAEDLARLAERVPYRGIPYERVVAIERGKERERRRKAVRDLEARKLITVRTIEGNLFVGLTKTGRTRLLREQIQWCRTTLPEPERCMVAFDIPAKAEKARKAFIGFLRRCHFSCHQWSVYSTANDVFALMAEFIQTSKIGRWVTILHVKKQT